MRIITIVAVFLSACTEPAPPEPTAETAETAETSAAILRPDVACLTTGCEDHTVCMIGQPLPADCNSCATAVCEQDPFCCSTTWDHMCVDETPTICRCRC